MQELGLDFDVKVIKMEETYPDHIQAADVAQYLAEKKAKQVPFLKEGELLVTADTTVVVNDIILGKPEDEEEARQMLTTLSGRTHQVITGVAMKSKEKFVSFDDTTEVYFRTLSDYEIDYYIKEYKPFDKAGAYGIQEWIGMVGINRILGSYFTVMGLPIHMIYQNMKIFV